MNTSTVELAANQRVRIVIDDEYDPREFADAAEDAAYVEEINSGKYIPYGVILERTCGECGTWQHQESLWGCVVEYYGADRTYTTLSDIKDDYLREVAGDLIREASVTVQ